MTAEVAVLNKLAVALAADSAVTIGDQNPKIYNTVNKIFELSESQAIGVMIYGGLNFMGLPLEVLVKEFRRTLRGRPPFARIPEAAEAFRQYLATVPVSRPDAEWNLLLVIDGPLRDLADRTQKRILAGANGGRILRSKFNSALRTEVRLESERIAALPACASLDRRTERQIDAGFEQLIDGIIDRRFSQFNPSSDTRRVLRRLVRLWMHRAELSPNRTGVVVAGYGSDDMCPTLVAHEMDGIIANRLKLVETKTVDISRDGIRADALGFAQDDMIEQFLHGVSDEYQSFSDSLWLEMLRQFASSVVTAAVQDAAVRQQIMQHLETNIIPGLDGEVARRIEHFKETTARQSVVSMVEHMPKQELSNLAAALVDLTSLKRRVSAQRETVGGEVDVAVISKSEGFVWVQRKHYFPPELNSRFSHRHYDSLHRSHHGEDQEP